MYWARPSNMLPGGLLGGPVGVIHEPSGFTLANKFENHAIKALVVSGANLGDYELIGCLGALGLALGVGVS